MSDILFIISVLPVMSDGDVCREGITFALSHPEGLVEGAPPPYVDFLSVLGEFSNRLLEVDKTGKKGVLVFLQVSGECVAHDHSRAVSFYRKN